MIRTPRLVLRDWRESDLEPFAAMSADPRVMEFFPPFGREELGRLDSARLRLALADEYARATIARWKAHFAEHGFGFLAVEVPGVADFVGICGMAWARFQAHFTPSVEIGWRLAYDHWGHGYAGEAAQGALDYGFATLGLDQIVAFAVVSNRRSRRVMERIGMTYDPADDFDHPGIEVGSPLRRHVLYRAARDGAPLKR